MSKQIVSQKNYLQHPSSNFGDSKIVSDKGKIIDIESRHFTGEP